MNELMLMQDGLQADASVSRRGFLKGALTAGLLCGGSALLQLANPGQEKAIADTSSAAGETAAVDAAASATAAADVAAGTTDAATTAAAKAAKQDLKGYVICIDPGHSSLYSMATTPASPGSSETNIVEPGGGAGPFSGGEHKTTLAVGLMMRDMLEARGATVVMTRTKQKVVMSSMKRAQIANKHKAHLFVRLHCDDIDDPSVSGFSTLIPGKRGYQKKKNVYKKSQKAGKYLHKQTLKKLGAKDAGVYKRSDLAGFNWCKCPSVLFEMGFMSNYAEDKKLASKKYRKKLASSMCDAIGRYLKKYEKPNKVQ